MQMNAMRTWCFRFHKRRMNGNTVLISVSAGADDFDSFVVFVESIVGKGFISLLDSIMQKVIIDILHRAGDASEWASGYTLPRSILQSATNALVNLSDIQSKSNAANFLAGTQFCLTCSPDSF
jgi:hypothetical protein